MDFLAFATAVILTLAASPAPQPAHSGSALSPSDASGLVEYSYLQAEVNLALRPQFYLVLEIPERVIRIKARGRVFKEWPIRVLRSWGDPISPLPQALEKKDALSDPKRPEIRAVIPAQQSPAESGSGQESPPEETPFRLDALELPDMPTSYTLILSGGLRLSVHPRRTPSSDAFWSRTSAYFARIADALFWNAAVSFHYLRSDRRPRLDIGLDPIAAREIYWHVPVGTQVLVIGRP